jgi:hypothetical protein
MVVNLVAGLLSIYPLLVVGRVVRRSVCVGLTPVAASQTITRILATISVITLWGMFPLVHTLRAFGAMHYLTARHVYLAVDIVDKASFFQLLLRLVIVRQVEAANKEWLAGLSHELNASAAVVDNTRLLLTQSR